MTQRYIVGYDDSGPSRRALEWALRRASANGGHVLLAHVRPGVAPGPGVTDDAPDDRTTSAGAGARSRHPDLAIGSVTLDGDVVTALLGIVDPTDVLVVGTHKTGHLHGRALGTTGLSLAAGATCAVVVVPDTDLRFRRGVVAGVAPGAHVAAVCAAAAAEADVRGDELVLLRAGESGGRQDGSDVLVDAARRLQEANPALRVSCRSTSREVAPALLDAALGHALLVIGAAHPRRLSAGHLSTVLHDVLINLTAPVLVTRTGGQDHPAPPRTAKETA
ncbi:nucleotide-binding universal stress UspA family protein [Curtobacterium pusillum]|uniref:Nucleotide-binding universal stress UspA family protein n=1 Tax=Curtobacterium pusillum TaxID=69373 RepID=A0AAW3T6X8_9MICO|nr:universal stress protein [Curtobacterium pusillum]MBA8990929.1 nucleotide-binding universal stress UspA family protein [Curtobacterium pusillum]